MLDFLQKAPPHSAWMLAGATATGKSAVAQWLAERCGAAILSADAMLVYRGMDIGTAKPSPAERQAVPYAGLDCIDPRESFSVGDWLACAQQGLACLAPPRPVIVAGGTGLYFRALLSGLDSVAADPARRQHWQALLAREGLPALWQALTDLQAESQLAPGDRNNPRRCIRALERAESLKSETGTSCLALPAANPPPRSGWRKGESPVIVALQMPREQLHARIDRRIRNMFDAGLVAEAVALRARNALSPTALQAIGYAEALALADNAISFEAAFARIAARTRQLAKRQLTWFRHQLSVHWIDIADDTPVEEVARLVLEAWRQHGPSPIQDRRPDAAPLFRDAHP
jgi:tRNA dimethylallyltransferase